VLASLAALLCALMVAGVALGAVHVSLAEVASSLTSAIGRDPRGLTDALIVDIRLPRVVLAALIGASLAGAGVLYQALFRNPLADPYILGISSGAGLGATLALVMTAGATGLRFGAVPAAAFAGALLTVGLVARLAAWRGRLDTTSLLLAGVAVSYTLAAASSFVVAVSLLATGGWLTALIVIVTVATFALEACPSLAL